MIKRGEVKKREFGLVSFSEVIAAAKKHRTGRPLRLTPRLLEEFRESKIAKIVAAAEACERNGRLYLPKEFWGTFAKAMLEKAGEFSGTRGNRSAPRKKT